MIRQNNAAPSWSCHSAVCAVKNNNFSNYLFTEYLSHYVAHISANRQFSVGWLNGALKTAHWNDSDVNKTKILRPRPRPMFLVSDRSCPMTDGLRPQSLEYDHCNSTKKEWKKRSQTRTLRAGLAVARRNQKFSPRRRPPSRWRRTAKI